MSIVQSVAPEGSSATINYGVQRQHKKQTIIHLYINSANAGGRTFELTEA